MATFLLATSCLLSTAACTSGAGDTGVASLSSPAQSSSGQVPNGQDGQDAFTKCMKDNGVDINSGGTPDDQNGGNSQGSASPADQRAQQEALDKCRQFLPDGGTAKPLGPEALEQARQFARCMRGKGVAYPDPDPNAGGGEGVSPIPKGVDASDPAVRDKMADCSRQANGLVPEPTK
jgi:hypothetical protein